MFRTHPSVPHPIRLGWAQRLSNGISTLAALLLIEALLVTSGSGHPPNHVSMPILDQLFLLETVWHSNPLPALAITLQQPVGMLEYRHPGTGLQVWGLYYYPLSLTGQLLVAMFAAVIADPGFFQYRKRLIRFVAGCLMAGLGLTYIRLGSCCGADPLWSFDLLLFAHASDPELGATGMLDWQFLYRHLEPALRPLQWAVVAGGYLLQISAARVPPRPGSMASPVT